MYALSHRQDNIYHSLCYTSCGALAGTRNNNNKYDDSIINDNNYNIKIIITIRMMTVMIITIIIITTMIISIVVVIKMINNDNNN